MADLTAQEGAAGTQTPTADPAFDALDRFASHSSSTRGGAILGPGGVLAATGGRQRWGSAAKALLDAADAAAGEPASHAHVATEEGEVYAVRVGGLAMVAVTGRFELASLVLADMRRALREAVS